MTLGMMKNDNTLVSYVAQVEQHLDSCIPLHHKNLRCHQHRIHQSYEGDPTQPCHNQRNFQKALQMHYPHLEVKLVPTTTIKATWACRNETNHSCCVTTSYYKLTGSNSMKYVKPSSMYLLYWQKTSQKIFSLSLPCK
jgi:hypothetical protein